MCSVEKRNRFMWVHRWKFREIGIQSRVNEVGRWKQGVRLGATACDAPVFGRVKLLCNFLEHDKMVIMGACRELRQHNGRIANVRLTCDISI